MTRSSWLGAALYRLGTFVRRLSLTSSPSTMARLSGPEAWITRPHMLAWSSTLPSSVPDRALRQPELPAAEPKVVHDRPRDFPALVLGERPAKPPDGRPGSGKP